MNSSKSVEVCINGIHYHISTGEQPAYLQELAHDVDTQIQRLLERNSSLGFAEAAVLCLLNYADNYRRSEEGADHMRSQISDYLEDAAKARIELDEVGRKMETCQRERDRLRQELERANHSLERMKAGASVTDTTKPALEDSAHTL